MKTLIQYAKDHRHLWRHEGDHYWLAQLHKELAKLTLTLDGQHPAPCDTCVAPADPGRCATNHVLLQIATISINWLEKERAIQYPEEDTP